MCLFVNPVTAWLHFHSLTHHGEPVALCIHTSITAGVGTLMLRCHHPARAMQSIPNEDELNRKSIDL